LSTNWPAPPNAAKLRGLAAWYREFAERALNRGILESRLRIADELEHEADLLDASNAPGFELRPG
jgi:hypothetical protein